MSSTCIYMPTLHVYVERLGKIPGPTPKNSFPIGERIPGRSSELLSLLAALTARIGAVWGLG